MHHLVKYLGDYIEGARDAWNRDVMHTTPRRGRAHRFKDEAEAQRWVDTIGVGSWKQRAEAFEILPA